MNININFPPSFDTNYCRTIYPQLKDFSDERLKKEFYPFAYEQGFSTCSYDRKEVAKILLQQIVDKFALKVLEIGPYDRPFFKGDTVKYFDVWDAETLREKAKNTVNRHFEGVPKKIHYVDDTGNLQIVEEKFDIVFSSHVVEHQPDLIRHLKNVERILNADGLYILFVPDKRYCFDYYKPDTDIFSILEAFVNKHSLHTIKTLMLNYMLNTHNEAFLHWRGDHGSFKITKEKFLKAKSDYEKSVSGGGVHRCTCLGIYSQKFWKYNRRIEQSGFNQSKKL